MTELSQRAERGGAVEELTARGFPVVVLDAGSWSSEQSVHRDMAVALDFPAYDGRNLDALNDCLSDVVARECRWRPSAAGLALVFLGFDRLAAALPDLAPTLVGILVTQALGAADAGATMALLLQSDDHGLSDSMSAPGAIGL